MPAGNEAETVHALTVVDATTLADGYSELLLQSTTELSPPPGPGQYLNIEITPGAPPVHAPIMQMQAPDRLQVLSRTPTPLARGTRIQGRIEGEIIRPDPAYPGLVLVSADDALACSILAATHLRTQYTLTVFAHFTAMVPFQPTPSQILMPGSPSGVIAAVPLFDSWDIPSRLASSREEHGFYHGDISGLLEYWWQQLDDSAQSQMQIMGFGDNLFLGNLRDWCEARNIPVRTAVIP